MSPLSSSKRESFKAIKKDSAITILGVMHIKPNLGPVLEELNKLRIDQNSLVFLEPRKNILTGMEKCKKKSIESFFFSIIRHLITKKASIIPLNATKMPSHDTNHVLHKYSAQLAEEEYMARLISETEQQGKKIVIIGDIHAKRLKELLNQMNKNADYIKLAPENPDDIIIQSIRKSLDGKSNSFISTKWLSLINDQIKKSMNIESRNIEQSSANFQEMFWENEKEFKLYIKHAKRLMKKYKSTRYQIKTSKDIRAISDDLRNVGRKVMAYYSKSDDHPIFTYPYKNFELSIPSVAQATE